MSSDFFSDLEQHLDRAAQRQARWGRLASAPLPSASGVLAAAVVAIVVAAGAFALPHVARDAETPAGPAPTPAEQLPGPPAGSLSERCEAALGEIRSQYAVMRSDDYTSGEPFVEPEGVSWLTEPVLAREAFGVRFFLIAAAQDPGCSEPLICVAADYATRDPACHQLTRRRSTPLTTRVDFGDAQEGPNMLLFAAAPDGLGDQLLEREGIEPLDFSAGGNMLVAGGRFEEERARRIAEAVAEAQLP